MSEERDDLRKKFGDMYGAEALGGELGLKGVRLSPSQYLGSKGVEGAEQAAIEIIQNSVDESAELVEFVKQYGGDVSKLPEFLIEFTVWKDDTVQIVDTGRGVPADFSKKFNRPVLEAVFEEINVGGKGKGYVEKDKSAYLGKTIGKHGSGAACANATSDFFYVTSYVMKDNKCYSAKWEKAEKIQATTEVGSANGRNGTIVKFRPSREVFDLYSDRRGKVERFYNFEFFKELLTEYAYNTDNIKFIFKFENEDGTWEEAVIRSAEHDPVERLKPYTDGHLYTAEIEDLEEDYHLNIVLGIARTRQEYLTCNMLRLVRGTHSTALSEVLVELLPIVATQATQALTEKKIKRAVSVSILNKMGITNPYAYLSSYLSIKMSDPDYSGQVKEELRVPRILDSLKEKFREVLNNELSELRDRLIDYLVNIAVSAIEAKHYEELRKEQLKKQNERKKELKEIIGKKDPKYVRGMSEEERDINHARNQNLKEVILFVVEGKTALSRMLEARDYNNHAILAMNQRPPNVFGHTFDQLKKMKKYRQLYKVFYGNNNGDYKAIVLATDPDPDGNLISSYIIGFLWLFFPKYLTQGRVFILDAPKHVAVNDKDEKRYFKSLAERNEFMKNNPAGWSYYTYKGLGSIPAETLSQILQDPEYFIQIDKNSVEEGMQYLKRFLTDKKYKKQLVLDLYGSPQLKYHTLMRSEILKHQEVEFDVNELSTQYTFEHDFSSIQKVTPLENLLINEKEVEATLTEEEEELIRIALEQEDFEGMLDDSYDEE